MKRIGRIGVFAVAIVMLAALLTTLDASRTTVDAASLKHIDEIVAASGTFNILEIVPDVNAASVGYTIDGQEPAAGWKTAAAVLTSPSARSQYVNGLFKRLADKGVLGSGTTTPLKYDYYDSTNQSYYTESYLVPDTTGWHRLSLSAPENVTLTGTMTPASGGPFRASFAYTPSDNGGYVQRIWYFMYTTAPNYGHGTYYYNPVFTAFTPDEDLTGKESYAVYTKDSSGNYIVDPGRITVGAYLTSGGFDSAQTYYYVNPTETGPPGNYSYAAVVDLMSDNDDTPGDGFMAAESGPSYFSRDVTGFTYVETGGNYAYAEGGGGTYTVSFPSVYYKAGFTNNNLFKTQVFGLDSSNMNALNVTVTVRRADQVTSADISGAGLIYLSAGTDITQGGVTTAYSSGNDIPDALAVGIYNYAADQSAVIVDYKIVQDVAQNTQPTVRMKKLSLLCLQSSLVPTTQTSLSGLSVNWTTLGYVSSDADKTFVNNNVYCFNPFHTDSTTGTSQATYVPALASPRFSDAFSSAVVASNFQSVLTEIQNENFLRTIAGQQDLLPENVTVSASVRHVINFKGQRSKNPKTQIKVLDLEPAKVTSSSWLTADTVRGWISNTLAADKITIVHMTTGEFVGKIEDLSETYDMIYIGMSTESLNNSGGNTLYNDTAMNGLIYSNIGDKYYATIEMAGIRIQDYLDVGGVSAINNASGTNANLFRFSGNDITKTAVTELQKYARAGYPLVLADGFVSTGSVINTAKVDNSSYMYEAVSGVYGPDKYPNVMTQAYAAANDPTVIKYLNVSKPQVVFAVDANKRQIKPAEYAENSTSVLQAADAANTANWAYGKGYLTTGCYYLYYDLTISNITDPTPISTTYDCRLFIDLNADGRFSDKEELGDIEVHQMTPEGAAGALVLPLTDGSGNEYYALSADARYEVTRQMPDDYVGIIPWKLEVIKNGADQIHASATGFTRIRPGADDKQPINILQIMQPGTETSKLNLHTQMTDPQGVYGKLIRGLEDFTVNIDAISADGLETKGTTPDDILDWLENKGLTGEKGYDMLIIGFNDCYDGIKANSAAAIVKYIGSGRSVLFTHDTTSLTQVPTSNFPMAINGTAPKVKTLQQTDVLYNTSASVYRSINGSINWYGAYSATTPPYVRQTGNTYVVLMNSNVTAADEDSYWKAKAGSDRNYQVYQMSDGSQVTWSITSATTLDGFKAAHQGATIIYVFCTAASGWYGTDYYVNTCDITTTNNFTKFVDTTKYTCTGLTYRYTQGRKNNLYFSSMTTTTYAQVMRDIYNVNPSTYAVVGTYDAATNTYSIGGSKYYPAKGASFPQSTLYDRDPTNQYTLSTLPNNITDWGYYFNTVIRDAVGLDRYGVTSSIPVYDGTTTLGKLVNVTAPMYFYDIPTVLANDRSVAYAPKSGKSSTVDEYQGYTNYALIRFPGSGNTYRYTNNTYSNRETTIVSQVNKGQITTYPYNVNTLSFGGNDSNIIKPGGSYMQIGSTHEQYFQINMNTDQIVVWYCLSNATYNGYTTTVDDSSYYDDVPNDCVNAYYIYNKGNVTYSGVGHTSNASLYTGSNPGQQYINEAKLFVNTMIAAYQSGEQSPTVRIKKDAHGTSDLAQKYMVVDEGDAAVPNDSQVLEESFGPTDDSRAVYFRITDPTFGAGKMITAQYFVSTDGGKTLVPLNGADGNPLVNYIPDDETLGTPVMPGDTLVGGYVYKFYLPDANCLDILKDPNIYSFRVYVKVTTAIPGLETKESTAFLEIRKQQLFELS
jgi:hypothetical protein